jgi:hypothetical protein
VATLQIINDSTPPDEYMDPTRGTGLDLSLKTADGYGATAKPFPQELLIPMSEVQARVQERKELKIRHRDLATQGDLQCKDQGQTNYCWINAPTYCLEYVRLWQNQEKVYLSPASGGAPIKNFSNRGGWGLEALQWISDKGLVPVDKWPANAIDRRYYTEENRQLAMNYRSPEWVELEPRNMQQLFSLVLRGIPVAGGYNWWAHEVTNVDVDWVDGEAVPVIRNSWGMGWKDMGYAILQGSKMYADDQVAPLVALA